MTQKPPLLILTGPTAAGKTDLSLLLAEALNGEIVSADSMQVYRRMDIGSAKIKPEERRGIPHHLIDVLEPTEEFNVVLFQHLAKAAISEIYGRGRLPILTGGTGFYIQAVLYDIDFTDTPDDGCLRRQLEELARQEGPGALHKRLAMIDPKAAEEIHENNVKRVIRALEYYEQTGEQISVHNRRERTRKAAYDFCYFVLNRPRQLLYEQINRRVDRMLEEGLAEETRKLYQEGCRPGMTSMQGLGYREMLGYLAGEYDLEQASYLIKRNTRHFAKRQLTWFGREKDVIWVEKDSFTKEDEIAAYLIETWRNRNNGKQSS